MPRNHPTLTELYYRVIGKATKSAIATDPGVAWHSYLQRTARRMEKGATDAEVRQQAARDEARLIVTDRVQCVRELGWKHTIAKQSGKMGGGQWALADTPAGQALTAGLPGSTGARVFDSEDEALEECQRQRKIQNSSNLKVLAVHRNGATEPEAWLVVNQGIACSDLGKTALCLLQDGSFGLRHV